MMNFLKKRLQVIFYPPGTTPMEWKLHLILFLCLLSSAMSITILFPFLPAMVKSFGQSDEETGYYAGLIASAMFVGRTVISYFWGWCADRFGRRPVILMNLAGLTASMMAFGLSVSLNMAIITRLFVGLSNGSVAIMKAVISEVCDETNQSLGMSVLMSSWNVGLILGPALGGFLAEPSRKYPDVFPKGSFFDKFAFFLPCLSNCVLALSSFMLAYFNLPETGIKSKESAESTEILESSIYMETQPESNIHKFSPESEKNHGLVENQQEEKAKQVELLIICEGRDRTVKCWACQTQRSTAKGCCLCCRNSIIVTLLRNRISMLAIAVYCLFSLVIIGFDELFALWAATHPSLGGLGFSTDQIGTALLCVVVPVLLLQLCVFPKLERRFGVTRVFPLACVLIALAIFAMPSVNNFYNKPNVLWFLLILLLLPIRLGVGCGFGSTAIFINNSVSRNLLASVNGLAMTLTSISRALAPIIGGSAFAWSISKGFKLGFPLNEYFAFIVFTVITIVTLLLSCLLPKHLNQRKTVRETTV